MKVYVGDEDSGCGSVPRSGMVLAVQLLRMDLGEFLCIDPAEKTGQPRFCQWSAADAVRHRRCYGIPDPAPV